MYKNLTERFDRLIKLCSVDGEAYALASEMKTEIVEAIQHAYGLAYNGNDDAVRWTLEDLLTEEECDAGKKEVESIGPYVIRDDSYGFVMTDNHGQPLSYASIADALEEIQSWFTQQSDTQSFSVIEYDTDETVGGAERDDEDEDNA